MVIDFTDLKKIVNSRIIERYDHALVLSKDALLMEQISHAYGNTIVTDFQPTSENLVAHFAKLIMEELPEKVSLVSVKLWETENSYAQWRAEDNL